jgi:S-adenosylmethionine:tRNA ribosyltransferase-isomerase
MQTSDYDYLLPPERIAQTPLEPRHAARLLVLPRGGGALEHRTFWDVCDYLHPGDLLVVNQTRVIPARIFARKPTGGRIELLLLRRTVDNTWEALVGGKRAAPGLTLTLENGPQVEILETLAGSRRLVRFTEPIEPYLERAGQMPLPPYIHTPLSDPQRYQTVYASQPGSAAAPTAGLHFTPQLLQRLQALGVQRAEVTLHVGLDTFAPVNEADPLDHAIHTEWCEVSPQATTSVRTLETAARVAVPGETVGACSGATGLYILPGFEFRAVDAMITNFHLPRSTLLMLVSAFTGRETILAAYAEAVRREYRFYSFGDAMLIL